MPVEKNKTYVGVVQQNDDPQKLGRVKVRVLSVFDKMELKDIPWATPWKDLNGNGFNIPEIGKLVTVIFESGNEYKPEYIYAEYFNINLEKKLKSLEGENYLSMKSLLFDHKTQVYVNDAEGLKLDHKFNNINITESEINISLKDNYGKVHIGDAHGDQQSILGTNFLNWFDKFIKALMCTQGPPYLLPTPISPSPSFLRICQEYLTLKDPKFLSQNVYLNDNSEITTIKTDLSVDPNLRINDPQIGDNIKTNIQEVKTPVQKQEVNYTPQQGNGTEETKAINEKGVQVPLSSETAISQGITEPVKEVKIPSSSPGLDKIVTVMLNKKSSDGRPYELVDKKYYINLIGIRNQYEGQPYSNKFVDKLWAIWRDETDIWQGVSWPISTMPGLYFSGSQLQKQWCKINRSAGPSQALGILKEGQYQKIYTLMEANPSSESAFAKKPYFASVGAQLAYRDLNWDSNLITYSNKSSPHKGGHGMLIHKGYPNGGGTVNNWSQGCQVFKNETDHDQLTSLARKHIKYHKNTFNYTLLLGTDLA